MRLEARQSPVSASVQANLPRSAPECICAGKPVRLPAQMRSGELRGKFACADALRGAPGHIYLHRCAPGPSASTPIPPPCQGCRGSFACTDAVRERITTASFWSGEDFCVIDRRTRATTGRIRHHHACHRRCLSARECGADHAIRKHSPELLFACLCRRASDRYAWAPTYIRLASLLKRGLASQDLWAPSISTRYFH